MSHVWGLFSHPDREMQVINRENETISHHYTHHVLLMAAIPVICAFIGTTQIGWNFGDGTILKLSWFTGLALAVLFYGVMLAGVAVMGRVIWWMARNYPQRPSLAHCMVFAGYVATPLFLSGLVALYPLVWLCALVGTVALFYTGYLLYLGIPSFLNINKEEGLSFSSSTLAIGVLVLEVLLALTPLYFHRLVRKAPDEYVCLLPFLSLPLIFRFYFSLLFFAFICRISFIYLVSYFFCFILLLFIFFASICFLLY